MTPEKLYVLMKALGTLALAVVIIAVFFIVFWILCLLVDGRKLRREQRGRMEPPAPEHPNCLCQIHPFDDDETKTWPGPEAGT